MTDADHYTRPGPLRWLRYAFGGRLPEQYHTWVLHDITCRTWVLRHIARGIVQLIAPITLGLLFIPTSMPIRVLTVIAAGGPCLLGVTINIIAMTSHRLIKAGYPPGLGEQMRSTRAITAQATANRARRERIAARAARRGR